jgi:hypothetical protein
MSEKLPGAVEPVEWFVVFHTQSSIRWLSFLACGKFKHVSAFGYYPGFKAWLVYDVAMGGTSLIMLSHERAKAVLPVYTNDCTVVKIARNAAPVGLSLASRLLFHCTPAIGNLVGLPCVATNPNHLYRHLLRNGGVIVYDAKSQHPGRSQPSDRAAAGSERSRLVVAD